MCGIFCYCGPWAEEELKQNYTSEGVSCSTCFENNRRRGPDDPRASIYSRDINGKWHAKFAGWVLWTQGFQMTHQPLRESTGNLLLWNGDIFSGALAQNSESDTQHLHSVLQTSTNIVDTLASIEGPYSFIYHDARTDSLYFGRDPIGRHSLLVNVVPEKRVLILSSVASKKMQNWMELPALGIFRMDLTRDDLNLTLFPWENIPEAIHQLEEDLNMKIKVEAPIGSLGVNDITSEPQLEDFVFMIPIDDKNIEVTMERLLRDEEISKRVEEVSKRLRDSVRLRVEKKPNYCMDCIKLKLEMNEVNCTHSKIGLLFSGGLDSTILAAIAHEFVPEKESIDLINVAFEKGEKGSKKIKRGDKNDEEKRENFDVPDRKTGRQAFEELKRLFPRRQWNFVESNVTRSELEECLRTRICHLIYPRRTILDESLGSALWFAARGSGTLAGTSESYQSPCRILLLGMGADELFGGYTRHRTIFRRKGWEGLGGELNAEIRRISERNLGRDDRVVADHGKQSRLPYLDDNFVRYVTSLKPWERCCPIDRMPPGLGDKLLLRLCAFKLGLKETSAFPKRAFQFGSRIAKSHENASDISKWLMW
ncbi:asparagine synthetase domain-containing protein 1 [Fopius arisanus]|uniref:ASNSD1 protein n=1 Tax=Fopius arisanus TaxID=64838 RepID=A0A0C9PP67_9HYME|nr:PREDICTED: asparagine synthetase domain-containing protein 1 [Fopius arisanus]